MSGFADWAGRPPKADPLVPFEEALANVPERPRMIDPLATDHQHITPEEGAEIIRLNATYHGRMELHARLIHPAEDRCPGCLHALKALLCQPVPTARMN